MKKIMLALLALLAATSLARAEETKMAVQVKSTPVRETPSFLGKLLGSLSYGDPVVVVEKPGDWIKIKSEKPSVTGWVHKSALTTKKIALTSGKGDANVKASSEELA